MNFLNAAQDKIAKTARTLASASVIFYTMPWLIVLLILGTVFQKNLGLYVAVETYLNSLIVWFGPIPLPGGLMTIGLIFLALSIKFIFFSPWNKKQAGIILTHLGILLLLLGGLVTSVSSKEGFMIIPEGESVDYFSDYMKRVVVLKQEGQDDILLPFDTLEIGSNIAPQNVEFSLKILDRCDNCSAQAPSGKYKDLKGLAANMELFSIPSDKNPEANFSGLILAFQSNENTDQNGTYIVMEDIPKNPIFKTEKGDIEILLTRENTVLPFSIQLKDFRKIDYPGTQKAKSYEADVIILDGGISWPVTISMNKPLRYKGYSFFQSSFEQRPDVEVTVLNVVKNVGSAFPYISSFIIFLGLMLHFIIRLRNQSVRKTQIS